MSDVVIVQPAPPSYVIVAATQGPSGSATIGVSGTGFLHATGGTLDPAARAVGLATADVTGTLQVANGGTGLAATGAVGTFLKTVSSGVLGFALLAAADLPTITLTGDVVGANAGGSIATQVQGIRGVSVPSPPGAGTTVLTDTSGVLSWVAPASTSVTGTGLWYSTAGALNAAAVTLSGDLTPSALSGSSLPVTVTGVNGKLVPALTVGVFQYSGSAWQISTVGPSLLAPGTSGQILQTNATPAANWVTVSGDTTIGATGITTTGKINGASVPVAGALTTGNVLQVTGVSALGYAAVNLAGGANFVTGNLPIGNLAPGTSAQMLMSNGTPATTWTTITGDWTPSATGVTTVTQARGGLVSWAVTTGIQTWSAAGTFSITQTSTASAVAANSSWQPQQSSNASPTGGNAIVSLQGGTGGESWLQGQRAGTTNFSIGGVPAAGSTITGIWLQNTAPNTTNHAIRADASSVYVNAQSSTGFVQFTCGNSVVGAFNNSVVGGRGMLHVLPGGVGLTSATSAIQTDGSSLTYYNAIGTGALINAGSTFALSWVSAGVQFFSGLQNLGGGSGVIGIEACTTKPSSASITGSGMVLFGTSGLFSSGVAGVQITGALGATTTLANSGPASGTINTQSCYVDQAWGTCRTTSSSTPTTILIYTTPSATCGNFQILVMSRAITTGTGIAVGDSSGQYYMLGWRNVGGTVTLSTVGIQTYITSGTGWNSSASTGIGAPVLTASVASNQITLKVANSALCTIDSQVWVWNAMC